MMKYLLLILVAAFAFAADPAPPTAPAKLSADKALYIAKLEAKRNALAADLNSTVLQAERLQKQLQDAQSAYLSAIDVERKAAKLPATCTLEESETWKCPPPAPANDKDKTKPNDQEKK